MCSDCWLMLMVASNMIHLPISANILTHPHPPQPITINLPVLTVCCIPWSYGQGQKALTGTLISWSMKSSALKRRKKLTPLDSTRNLPSPPPLVLCLSLSLLQPALNVDLWQWNLISCRYYFCCNVPHLPPPCTVWQSLVRFRLQSLHITCFLLYYSCLLCTHFVCITSREQ